MPKDNVHYGGWEHRDVHNINGMLFVRVMMYFILLVLTSGYIVQSHFPSGRSEDKSTEASICPHSLLLRWFAAVWCDVDW